MLTRWGKAGLILVGLAVGLALVALAFVLTIGATPAAAQKPRLSYVSGLGEDPSAPGHWSRVAVCGTRPSTLPPMALMQTHIPTWLPIQIIIHLAWPCQIVFGPQDC